MNAKHIFFIIFSLTIPQFCSFANYTCDQNFDEQITQLADTSLRKLDVPTFSTEDWKNLIIQVVTFIFILALGSFALIKLQRGGKFGSFSKNNKYSKLKILETKPLGNRQYVVVIEYENSKILLGISQHNVQFLTKFDQTDQGE